MSKQNTKLFFQVQKFYFTAAKKRDLFPGFHLFSCQLLLGNFFNFNLILSTWYHLFTLSQDHLNVAWRTHVSCNKKKKKRKKETHEIE